MAEYVEQRMEEMIPEVEELERVGLLSSEEVKELIKKRKHFEYKIQKRTKQKEDYLGYIQYESNLLAFIQLRRDSIGYQHKKGQIEAGIRNRINKLYKIMCHRWQSDVKIWLSHIDWLTKMKWKGAVSKVHIRLLQVHNNNPKLWIAAAKFEFESGAAENGRQIMLRGLRFHPKSTLLHREYIKFELLYVEALMARKKVLGLVKKNGEEEDEDEEKTKDKKTVDEEISDSILNCDLVNLVVEAALEAVPDPEFAVSVLLTVRQFPFSLGVQRSLLHLLETRWREHPVTLDTRARLLLEQDGKLSEILAEVVSIYRHGLESSPTAELFNFAFSTLAELPNSAPSSARRILKELLGLLQLGREKNLVSIGQLEFWLKLINVADNKVERAELLQYALNRYPGHLEFWLAQLSLDVEKGDYSTTLARAQAAVAGREQLWTGVMQMLTRAGRAEEAYSLLQAATEKENCGELRVLLLEGSREKGLQTARNVYIKYRLLPPFNQGLHKTMLEVELEQPKVNKKEVRSIFGNFCNQFGSDRVEPWLQWIQWEQASGSAMEVASIVCRAEASLSSDLLRNKLTVIRELGN